MPTKIEKKIVGYAVVAKDAAPAQEAAAPVQAQPVQAPVFSPTVMNESVARPDILVGRTYKISKSPATEHAMYVTINDIVLDAGTKHEVRRPFEVFINSKNMDQFQWVVAMTRIISAVFRKGGDVSFLAEEMKAVFDPHGGYFRPGGFVPSLVAEIGGIIEQHLKGLGMIEDPGMDPATRALLDEKRRAYEAVHAAPATPAANSIATVETDTGGYPASATLCNKCHTKAVVIMDGCATCLECGNSKCG